MANFDANVGDRTFFGDLRLVAPNTLCETISFDYKDLGSLGEALGIL